jgi:YebC/PmpR family DNA-binding regulatory protein
MTLSAFNPSLEPDTIRIRHGLRTGIPSTNGSRARTFALEFSRFLLEVITMAGHSKWKQIKRKKAVNDNRRGASVSKHLAAITAAVRSGGSGDPSANLSLKNALAAARTDKVPNDHVSRAIERAVGASSGPGPEEVVYEGYGPNGVAILVYALTDNRNRTAPEVRHVFTKLGGSMSGGVAWMFERKGIITLPKNDDATQELAIELGADDLEAYDDEGEPRLDVYTTFADMIPVAEGFRAKHLEPLVAEFTSIAANTIELEAADAGKVVKLLEMLEDLDDVQNVYSNANLENME